MDIKQIIALHEQGFNAEQISTIASMFSAPAGDQTETPAAPQPEALPADTPAAPQPEAPQPEAPQPAAPAVDLSPVLESIRQLTAALQASNLRGAQQPEAPEADVTQILGSAAKIIKPTHKKEVK